MRWNQTTSVCIAMLLLGLCGNASAQAGIAYVTDLKGDVLIDKKRAALLAEVVDGQKLTLAGDSTVFVMIAQSGEEFSLTGPGEYLFRGREVVPARSDAAGKLTKRSTSWRQELGHLVNMTRTGTASLRMRGIPAQSDGRLKIQGPAGKVASMAPVLRWSGPQGSAYQVQLTTDGKSVGTYSEVSHPFTVPLKLAPGATYRWTVSLGEQSASAEFTMLGQDALERLARIEPRTQSSFSDRLLYAATLHQLGAHEDARESMAALAMLRPDLPELAQLADR
jgi:hypothetical protein